ncbi:acetyl-CoA carboxylase carboxyl transferase subunit alpha, partial [bacterium]|nr:acetyl-CoA carboxylase carboxyl transferase subunit alpha [bacterium]
MASQYQLEFEKPVFELEQKIQELADIAGDNAELKTEVAKLEKKVDKMREVIFANLSRWQMVQVARHIDRPFTLDYITHIFTDFVELHGD